METVVLPQPPFWFTIATVLMFVSGYERHKGRLPHTDGHSFQV
jgi:hypothetical protein